jgi:hypothetical protein
MLPLFPQRLAVITLASLLAVTPNFSVQAATLVQRPATLLAKSDHLLKQLPATVSAAVFKDITKSFGVQRSALKVVQAKAHTWPDGCLGLAEAGMMCTQALVPGWQVTVKSPRSRWVYRTNADGLVVKLDQAASRLPDQALQPTRMTDRDLPPALTADTLFRVITSGGFTGQVRQTLLMQDGRVLQSRLNPDGTLSDPQTVRVDPQQLRNFQAVIAAAPMESFDRLNYPARPGGADFFTFTLTSRAGTVQYAETVKNQLPDRLKTIIQAWDEMVHS